MRLDQLLRIERLIYSDILEEGKYSFVKEYREQIKQTIMKIENIVKEE